MIFDSDVLIWALKGNLKADRVIANAACRLTSAANYMEVVKGVRDKAELRTLREFLAKTGFQILPLTESISDRAVLYMEKYALGVGLSAVDALVAGTAVEHELPLCTANDKHFRHLSGLTLKVFRPH